MIKFFKRRALRKRIAEGERILAEVDRLKPEHVDEAHAQRAVAIWARASLVFARLNRLRGELSRL